MSAPTAVFGRIEGSLARAVEVASQLEVLLDAHRPAVDAHGPVQLAADVATRLVKVNNTAVIEVVHEQDLSLDVANACKEVQQLKELAEQLQAALEIAHELSAQLECRVRVARLAFAHLSAVGAP